MKRSNFFKRFMAIVLLSVMLGVPVFGATVGEDVNAFEKGWRQLYFNDPDFYTGDISDSKNYDKGVVVQASNYQTLATNASNKKFNFKFKGTQLRIAGLGDPSLSIDNKIIIDGRAYTLQAHANDGTQHLNILMFEKLSLEDKIHEVTIISGSPKVGVNNGGRYTIKGIYTNPSGKLVPYTPTILDIKPEKSTINLNEILTANLEIDNITNIAAEDILIDYDQTKLEYVGMEEIPGIKMVHSSDDKAKGQLRLILASQGEANIINTKKILLKLKFKGIHVGDGLINITKAKVADGITLEKELLAKNCGDATITIVSPKDVNRSGEYTLLDLSIDARHFGKDPKSAELSSYDTDVVINNAIDNDDLLKIAQEMLANSNYVFSN
jgi:hypothetical protein